MSKKPLANTFPPSFDRYLKEEFYPAQAWAKSEDGKEWIKRVIPSLTELIRSDYDTCIFGVYRICIHGTTLYIGESVRLVRRLIVHAWHLRFHSELRFGLLPNEVETAGISVEILTKYVYKKADRLAEEAWWVRKLKPILQNSGDTCLPRNERRFAIQRALNLQ